MKDWTREEHAAWMAAKAAEYRGEGPRPPDPLELLEAPPAPAGVLRQGELF